MDTSKFINSHQVGGIESYVFANGEARNTRALLVNTGRGLRYRVLPDRGLDIDQAFFNQHSLTFLSYKGVTPPTRALDRGLDWLKGFAVGLLTTCGPTNVGAPATDNGEEVGLHGPHSNTAATLEAITNPDPRGGKLDLSVTGSVRYGGFYGPCIELRRTISSRLGENWIDVRDELFNAGNEDQPHGWLLHINLGYPLCDAGAEFCYDAKKVEPVGGEASERWFSDENEKGYKRMPAPLKEHHGPNSFVAYLYPKAKDRSGATTVGVVNKRLGLGLAIHYNTREFPRCANWQHWGEHEYVCALEPANGGVEGRDKDRQRGWLDTLPAGGRKSYRYRIEVVTEKGVLNDLLELNKKG
jgi:hypothetical protein